MNETNITNVTVKTLPCCVCGKTSRVELTAVQFQEFKSDGRRFIQDIFPDWSVDKRELLITGTHPACWDKIFGSDEDQDEELSQFDIDHAHGADFNE